MKRLVLCFILVSACATPVHQGVSSAVQTSSASETPRDLRAAALTPPSPLFVFEGVEVFGSKKVPKEKLLEVIGLPFVGKTFNFEKDEFTPYMVESKARLTATYPFAFCRYSLVSYPTHTFRLTVDLVDPSDEWRMKFSPAPQGDIPDPAGLIAAWEQYRKSHRKLRREGAVPESGEGSCHALNCYGGFAHPDLALLEQRFIDDVPRNADALVRVLREDRDDGKRMNALMLLPYINSREQLVNLILPSVRDPFEGVRNEVLRLLGTVQKGQQRILIPLEPVLDALWYPLATDRNKAAWALVRIVETEGDVHRRQILDKAGDVLVDMAGMKQRTDAEPARRVLTILAGRDLGGQSSEWRRWVDQARGGGTSER